MILSSVATHGVNWSTVAAIAGPILSIMGVIGRALSRKLERVITQLEHLNAKQQTQAERISRLEGPVRRTEQAIKDQE